MIKSAQNTIVYADRIRRGKTDTIHVLMDNLRKLVPDEDMQDNIGALMEKVGNIRTGMPANEVRRLVEADPKAMKAMKELQYQFEKVRQDINKYLKDMSLDEYIKFLEDYLPHFYTDGKQKQNGFIGKWSKTSPNAKHRTIPDLQEAVEAGLTPITQNPFKLLDRYADINWRMATNRRLIFDIRGIVDPDTGKSVISKEKVEGYKRLDHSAFNQLYAQRLPDGTLKLWEHGAWVHPQIYDALQSILENPIDGSVGKWMKAIQVVNAIGKEFITISGFHNLWLTGPLVQHRQRVCHDRRPSRDIRHRRQGHPLHQHSGHYPDQGGPGAAQRPGFRRKVCIGREHAGAGSPGRRIRTDAGNLGGQSEAVPGVGGRGQKAAPA
jgi:hypothetical protein